MSIVNPPYFAYSLDGCRIAYWAVGDRQLPAIVFLHGFGFDHQVWKSQLEDPYLQKNFYLISLDIRGHGLSSKPDTREAYIDGRLWAEDLVCVLTATDAQQVTVVAWSYAGRMLNDYLQFRGSQHLVGINYIAAATLSEPIFAGPAHHILADLCSKDSALEQSAVRKFVETVIPSSPYKSEVDFFRVLAETTPTQRLWLRDRSLCYDELLKKLDLPVLISHGEQDPFVLPLLGARLNDHIKNSILSLYPQTGHAPFLENAGRFNSELGCFALQCIAQKYKQLPRVNL